MNKRGAVGLPINLLVVIIISLVILGGGISLLYKLTSGAEEQKNKLDAKTESELRRLLEIESQKVALPLNTAHLTPGEFHTFGLGVLNIFKDETDFTVTVEESKAYDPQEVELTPVWGDWKFLFFSETGPIKNNEYTTVPIGIEVPKTAEKGTYIFNVEVTCGEDPACNPYRNVKKLYIIVK